MYLLLMYDWGSCSISNTQESESEEAEINDGVSVRVHDPFHVLPFVLSRENL